MMNVLQVQDDLKNFSEDQLIKERLTACDEDNCGVAGGFKNWRIVTKDGDEIKNMDLVLPRMSILEEL